VLQGSDGSARAEQSSRRSQRDRVLKRGKIIFGTSILDCIVLDISPHGARVDCASPVIIPEAVDLRLGDGSTYPASQRWARGTEIGLLFTGPAAASGDEGHFRRARDALQALQAAAATGWLDILRAERFFGDEMLHQVAEAAEAAHLRLAEVLRPHASRVRQDGPSAAE
jgi:hypothetical protein